MRWSTGSQVASARMRRVEVSEVRPPSAVRITTSAGLQVEGLSLADVIELLRALG
jgi:hypothetical protein